MVTCHHIFSPGFRGVSPSYLFRCGRHEGRLWWPLPVHIRHLCKIFLWGSLDVRQPEGEKREMGLCAGLDGCGNRWGALVGTACGMGEF